MYLFWLGVCGSLSSVRERNFDLFSGLHVIACVRRAVLRFRDESDTAPAVLSPVLHGMSQPCANSVVRAYVCSLLMCVLNACYASVAKLLSRKYHYSLKTIQLALFFNVIYLVMGGESKCLITHYSPGL